MSRRDFEKILGISGPTITWHMKRLIEDGLLSPHKDGRFSRYGAVRRDTILPGKIRYVHDGIAGRNRNCPVPCHGRDYRHLMGFLLVFTGLFFHTVLNGMSAWKASNNTPKKIFPGPPNQNKPLELSSLL